MRMLSNTKYSTRTYIYINNQLINEPNEYCKILIQNFNVFYYYG